MNNLNYEAFQSLVKEQTLSEILDGCEKTYKGLYFRKSVNSKTQHNQQKKIMKGRKNV